MHAHELRDEHSQRQQELRSLLALLTIHGNAIYGNAFHDNAIDFCHLLNLWIIYCMLVFAPLKQWLLALHRRRPRMNQGTRSLKRQVTAGHVRRKSFADMYGYVGIANFGKRDWKFRWLGGGRTGPQGQRVSRFGSPSVGSWNPRPGDGEAWGGQGRPGGENRGWALHPLRLPHNEASLQ